MDFLSRLRSYNRSQIHTNIIKVIPSGKLDLSRGSSFPLVLPPPEERLENEENEGGLCQVCRPISLNPQVDHWIAKSYGTAQQIFSRRHCAICRLVLWTLAQDMGFLDPVNLANDGPKFNCIVEWNVGPNKTPYLAISAENKKRGVILGLSLGSPELEKRKHLLGSGCQKKAENGNLDIARIRAWIDECEQQHSGCCSVERVGFASSKQKILTLIDVDRMQLVEVPSTSRYIALSYVWGQVPMFKTTKATLPALQQERGLLLFKDEIPSAIKDAINLVAALRVGYLWVDSLCIVQDDIVQKQEQISQMHIIYGQAYLTIVAVAAKTANSRLPGVGPNTRMSIPTLEVVQNHYLVPKHKGMQLMLEDSVYESRAWTLQERLLSKRCLFLTQWTAYYQCNSVEFTEDEDLFEDDSCDGSLDTSKSNSSFRPQTVLWNPLSEAHSNSSNHEGFCIYGFGVYVSLVEIYTKRRLSNSSDILSAFRGIGRTLEQQYRGILVNGLPEALLDLAILWSPAEVAVRRRKVIAETSQEKSSFPSWTWAGWEGGIDFILPENMLHFSKPGNVSIKIEIGMLSIGSLSHSRPVDRQYFSDVIEYPICPPSRQNHNYDEGSDEDVLHFWTSTTSTENFDIRGQQTYHLQEPLPVTRILDEWGNHCGLLLNYENAISVDKWSSDSVYEFALLSTTTLFDLDPFFAVSLRFRVNNGQVDELVFDNRVYGLRGEEMWLVNVMLIEWKGAFAERVAIGQMHKDAWTTVNRKRKYVRLI